MTESFLSRQYDLQISAPKLFIPKADEKPPPLQETSRLPAGTWLLMPLPTAQLKSFRNQTSNCKSLCRTNSSRQAVSAAGGSPFNWDLRVQMQNKDKILLWYHLSSWRLFISVEACYMTVPLFVTVVSLHLGFRTQLYLFSKKGKNIWWENEKVRANHIFICSSNSNKLAQSFKSTKRTHQAEREQINCSTKCSGSKSKSHIYFSSFVPSCRPLGR